MKALLVSFMILISVSLFAQQDITFETNVLNGNQVEVSVLCQGIQNAEAVSMKYLVQPNLQGSQPLQSLAAHSSKLAGYLVNFTSGVLTISAGYYIFEPKEDWIDSITSMPVSMYLGYSIPLLSSIRLIPALGGGYILHTVSHDERGKSPIADYEYTENKYNDPLAAVKLTIDWAITAPVHIVIAPTYTYFFEENSTNQILGVEAGLNICF